MITTIAFSAVLIVLFSDVQAIFLQKSHNGGNNVQTSYDLDKRQKRGATVIGRAALEGLRAVKVLLQGTKLTFAEGRGRIFEKHGGFSQAMKDFESVNPTAVIVDDKYWIGRRGRVGDRDITVQKHGWLGKPSVYIIKTGRTPSTPTNMDTIIYKD